MQRKFKSEHHSWKDKGKNAAMQYNAILSQT